MFKTTTKLLLYLYSTPSWLMFYVKLTKFNNTQMTCYKECYDNAILNLCAVFGTETVQVTPLRRTVPSSPYSKRTVSKGMRAVKLQH